MWKLHGCSDVVLEWFRGWEAQMKMDTAKIRAHEVIHLDPPSNYRIFRDYRLIFHASIGQMFLGTTERSVVHAMLLSNASLFWGERSYNSKLETFDEWFWLTIGMLSFVSGSKMVIPPLQIISFSKTVFTCFRSSYVLLWVIRFIFPATESRVRQCCSPRAMLIGSVNYTLFSVFLPILLQ